MPSSSPVTPIIAIGASAGGLEAVSRLFDDFPADAGVAIILIQHLDPIHPSLMAELLAKHTAMHVVEATDGAAVQPNQVQVIPPGRYLSVHAGMLKLSAIQPQNGERLPFDFLLASLAESCGPRTTAVILSGTGSDGSIGIRALKDAGGFVIAQSPDEADYAGMPDSAIATGQVDQVLPLSEMPRAIVGRALLTTHTGLLHRTAPSLPDRIDLAPIIDFLKDHSQHDFRQYKQGTIARRIERRIGLLGIARGDLDGYLDLLRRDPSECDLLARDLLINVTSFFRDPKVFETLGKSILPEIIEKLPETRPLRVWVAGCSTGEEAYSIAMECYDAIAVAKRDIKLQVFASDLDPDAIASARDGFYPLDIVDRISPNRLARFFIKEETGYRVVPSLRGDVVFTVQDVLADPPFSRMDLVSCRNLLIYLTPDAQADVISRFHFALREGGMLLLGSAETIGKTEGRFEIAAKAERIYRNVSRGTSHGHDLPLIFDDGPRAPAARKDVPPTRPGNLADICARAVLATHAPAAVLINRKRQCLYSMGPTERYLRMAPGYATLDLLAMATPALRTKLRLAIDKVSPAHPHVDAGRARLNHKGAAFWFGIDVECVAGEDDMLLVCFIEDTARDAVSPSSGKRINSSRINELEHELELSQTELQSAIHAQEAASQEHRAINEEALSVNEEFQSTNEELLTSKEELQSLNEELTALNSQLQETLERQRLTSDDLQNVLYSTNVGTLFLDLQLKIRFFTPAVRSLFNVIQSDVGRPLADLRSIAADNNLLVDAGTVLSDNTTVEREVVTPDNTWFLRRIFPYRAHDGKVEGVVITFADITDRKLIATALEASKLEAERANNAKSRFLAAASHDLRQPLQSLTLLQELLSQAVSGERPQRLLERFEKTLGAMTGMLDALLDINQIESGIVEPEISIFPVSTVFEHLRDEMSYLAESRGLILHIQPCAVLVKSDPRLLEQMVRNLLGNALKYTKKGKVLLGCRRRGGNLQIEVWDTGIGIAEAELDAIFEEFHQVDNPARERSRGLGLGLTIVQRLGQLLGHNVDVRSVPNHGSTFVITVPRAANVPDQSASIAKASDKVRAGPNHRCKIMMVDDDPDVLDLLQQLLTGRGHTTRSATDANTAMALISAGAIKPGIVLTDYNLPNGINGLELLIRLRQTLGQQLPAIILTGDISTNTIAKIAGENCIRLSKPVKPRELTKAIERLCLCQPDAINPD